MSDNNKSLTFLKDYITGQKYLSAKKKNKLQYRDDCEALAHLEELEKQLEQKDKAIELYEKCRAFYADKVNWIENQIGDFDIEQDGYGICDPEWGGKFARETGEKVKEIRDGK